MISPPVLSVTDLLAAKLVVVFVVAAPEVLTVAAFCKPLFVRFEEFPLVFTVLPPVVFKAFEAPEVRLVAVVTPPDEEPVTVVGLFVAILEVPDELEPVFGGTIVPLAEGVGFEILGAEAVGLLAEIEFVSPIFGWIAPELEDPLEVLLVELPAILGPLACKVETVGSLAPDISGIEPLVDPATLLTITEPSTTVFGFMPSKNLL